MSAPAPKRLLEQARQLATREKKRPLQVSLRRAVSAAYYALFHLLVREASRSLARGADKRLRLLLPRAFMHEEMASACKTFAASGTMPAMIASIYPGLVIPPEIASVAQAFVDLQKARHDADYATHRLWTRTMALSEVERAEQAFSNWEKVQSRSKKTGPVPTPAVAEAARLFLAWLVFQKKLQGR
jgi:uncharacterized protein (UPF0332 family)